MSIVIIIALVLSLLFTEDKMVRMQNTIEESIHCPAPVVRDADLEEGVLLVECPMQNMDSTWIVEMDADTTVALEGEG